MSAYSQWYIQLGRVSDTGVFKNVRRSVMRSFSHFVLHKEKKPFWRRQMILHDLLGLL